MPCPGAESSEKVKPKPCLSQGGWERRPGLAGTSTLRLDEKRLADSWESEVGISCKN